MFSVNLSSDMQRIPTLDRLQPSGDDFLPNEVERILVEVEGSRLVLCLEGTQDGFEQNVFEEKSEDEADNRAFRVDSGP